MGTEVKQAASQSFLDAVAAAVARFGGAVGPRLRRGSGGAEEQLRGPFSDLLYDFASALGVEILTVGETPLATLGIRPDFMVDVGGARVGYVELKAPGRKVPTTWTPTAREQQQWEKLALLPNVLYTDGTQWALFRYGERVGEVAHLSGDLRRVDRKLRPADDEFARVVTDFLLWKPDPPRSVQQLVRAVANLCRLLRSEVIDTIGRENTGIERSPIFSGLAEDWRQYMFPGLSDQEFADSYAQTVAFALLLARVDGISFEGRSLAEVARMLGKKHSLMGRSLSVLTANGVEGRSVVVATLQRVIGAVDWDILSSGNSDTYLHFYERFLEQYDPELRQQSGSYYTPNEVVSFMVRFVDRLLRSKLGKPWGLGTEDVEIVDPAMGTGTYLLNILDEVAKTVAEEEGPAAVPPQLRALFGRLIGFERQTGPYAVAELRVHQALKAQYKTEVPEKEVQFYIADTLDNPYVEESYIPSMLEPIARSRSKANKVKRETPVLVVIGNPPYRERARGLGGWIENGEGQRGEHVPLHDFRAAGLGRYENVLSNLYVYFWRWATWKVFDAHPDSPAGVVAFITPSSFTTGKGYAGMREYLRRTADEGWIVDLSPEEHQPPVSTRVFPGVQHRLCIGVFARYGMKNQDKPAQVHYSSVHGMRADKYTALMGLDIAGPQWIDCPSGWQDLFGPASSDEWHSCPALGDLMPWSQTGLTPNRNWVHSPDVATLKLRWERLILSPADQKPGLMKETSDRDIVKIPQPLPGAARAVASIGSETALVPSIERIALRSFDRQYVIYDSRVIDRPRPPLWEVRGPNQVYVTEQHAHSITTGPGLTFTSLVPSVHHFNGRGGRVFPLYRDPGGLSSNIAPGFIATLSSRLAMHVTADDVLAYIAGLVAHPGYTARFIDNLRTPGIRIPITADPESWADAVTIGREVIWLHTFGDRFTDPSQGRPRSSPKLRGNRRPQVVEVIPDTPNGMPDSIFYTRDTETLHVGIGRITPVPARVWNYEVGGMKVVKHWFDYRKKVPSGKRTSPLDEIYPDQWPAKFTSELLELLHVLGRCVDLHERQTELLERICAGQCISMTELEQHGILPPAASARSPLLNPAEPTLL
ncbi:type ISP restriction/modification enzyme [Nocardia gipuzkoensis]